MANNVWDDSSRAAPWDPNPAAGTRLATSPDVTELSILVVDRVTPSQVKVHDDGFPNSSHTLRRSDGRRVGSTGGTWTQAVVLTPALVKELGAYRRKRSLKTWAAQGVVKDLAQLDLEQLAFLRRLVGGLRTGVLPEVLQAAGNLPDEIMQLPSTPGQEAHDDSFHAYERGHREACQAAAERTSVALAVLLAQFGGKPPICRSAPNTDQTTGELTHSPQAT